MGEGVAIDPLPSKQKHVTVFSDNTLCVYARVGVCMHACACVCVVCVCAHVCVCTCACVHVCVCVVGGALRLWDMLSDSLDSENPPSTGKSLSATLLRLC